MSEILASKTFIGNIPFTINHTNTHLHFAATPLDSPSIEKTFTKAQMKTRWDHFNTFQSIKEIYDYLITLGLEHKLFCQVINDSYCLIIEVKMNYTVKTIEIPLSPSSLNNKFDLIRSSIQSYAEMDTGDESKGSCNHAFSPEPKSKKHKSILYDRTSRTPSKKDKKNLLQSLRNPSNIFYNDHDIEMIMLKNVTTYDKIGSASPATTQSQKLRMERMKSRDEETKLGFLKKAEIDELKSWCNLDDDDKEYHFDLLYHPSLGEDTETIAIKKFYEEAPLIILIKTSLGMKFGGYTSVGWDKPSTDTNDYAFKPDPNAFLFSIDKSKKYPIKDAKSNTALRCDNECIAWFYKGLCLMENFMSKADNVVSLKNYGNEEPLYEINNGLRDFKVNDLYVYKVIHVKAKE